MNIIVINLELKEYFIIQLMELIDVVLKRLCLCCLKVTIKRIQLKRFYLYCQYVKIRRLDSELDILKGLLLLI